MWQRVKPSKERPDYHYLLVNIPTAYDSSDLIKQEAELTAPVAALGHGQVDELFGLRETSAIITTSTPN